MRKLRALVAVTSTIAALGVVNCSSASATGEWLGCRISPGTEFNFYQFCTTTQAASTYYVAFQLLNDSGLSSYSWSIPTAYQSSIYSGCTSTTNYCTIRAHASGQEIAVTVNGGLTAYAEMEPWGCSSQEC